MTNHRKRRVRDMTAIYCGKRKGKRYEIMKVNSCHIPFLSFTLRFTSGTEVGRNDRHEEWNDEPKDRGTEASK